MLQFFLGHATLEADKVLLAEGSGYAEWGGGTGKGEKEQ